MYRPDDSSRSPGDVARLARTVIDPAGQALLAAVDWIATGMAGRLATAVAVVAVAAIGLLLLGGRLPIRRAALAITGCFIVFSSSTIAQGFMAAVDAPMSSPIATAPPAQIAPSQAAIDGPKPYDPFAGAAVPLPSEQPVIR